MTFSVSESEVAWRGRAAARSLAGAAARSDAQLDRLVAAARRAAGAHGPGFTVAQVVEQSGLSLKTFYRHFASKDELLLALFEEDNRRGAAALSAIVEPLRHPADRLRGYLVGLFCLVAAGAATGYTRLLVHQHFRLAESHPEELRQAHAPLVDLLERELRAAAAAGVTRAGDPHRDAVALFHALVAQIHAHVLGQLPGEPTELAEYLWRRHARGLLDSPGARPRPTGRRR